MVKIFERDGKLNIVDDRNVLVGFEYEAECYEQFGYKLTSENGTEVHDSVVEKNDYSFDTAYIKELDIKEAEELYGDSLEEGGAVQFKLVHDVMPPVYVTLFNAHNGYYQHGFEFKSGETVLQNGYI